MDLLRIILFFALTSQVWAFTGTSNQTNGNAYVARRLYLTFTGTNAQTFHWAINGSAYNTSNFQQGSSFYSIDIPYTGLSSVPQTLYGAPRVITLQYKWGASGTVYTSSYTNPLAILNLTYSAGGPTYFFAYNSDVLWELDRSTGAIVDTSPPVILADLSAVLSALNGKVVRMPVYVPAGPQNITLSLGKISGPADTGFYNLDGGATGGFAYVNVAIPATGWDGSMQLNGLPVDLAAKVSTIDGGNGTLYGNPYQVTNPPVGQTKSVTLPSGITPQQYYGLPAGITAGAYLPLPTGVTGVVPKPSTSGQFVAKVSYSNGSSSTVGATSTGIFNATATAGTASALPKSISSSYATSQAAISEVDGIAVQESALEAGIADSESDKFTIPSGLSEFEANQLSITNNMASFFDKITGAIGDGNLPRANSLVFTANTSRHGTLAHTWDLTASPFSVMREWSKVLILLAVSFFTVKFVRV